jgi:hypothetical protein
MKGEPEPYTEADADASLRQAYSSPARDPWTATQPDDQRPIINVIAGQLPWIVDQARDVLASHAEPLRLFQRGTNIFRIFSLPEERKTRWGRTALTRHPGTLVLEPLCPAALSDYFGRIIRWQRIKKQGGNFASYDVDCPPQVAVYYRSRTNDWKLPVLNGIISAPILRPDGTVLYRAGYDRATGLFLTEDWPEINPKPTRDDAIQAMASIVETFNEFPFVTEADRSVFLAAILTALQRRLLESAPLFAFSAPAQRTGKSLLAECVAILATGVEAPAMAVSDNHEELRKAVAAVLLEGHAVVNLDNIEQPLKSPDLSRAITQPYYQDRVLGKTGTTGSMPTNLLWTATGNNLAFRGDLAVRTLVCQLDAQRERPEERAFRIPCLKTHIAQHRQQLVTSALTILSAYAQAGSPDPKLETWGGFENWSACIRAPLVWLGLTDPYETRQHVVEDDPEREQAVALLTAWNSAFNDVSVRLLTVIQHANEDPDLKAALIAVAAGRDGHPNSRRLSHWCRSIENRITANFKLFRTRTLEGRGMWKVVHLGN